METMLDTNQFEFAAGNAVRPVMFQTGIAPDYPGVLGSSTMLTVNDRFFIACTRHQLKIGYGEEGRIESDASPLFISHKKSGYLDNIPVVRCLFSTESAEEEHAYILLFETTPAFAEEFSETRNFFQLATFWHGPRIQSLAIGCPTDRRTLEYDPLQVQFITEALPCNLDPIFISHAQFVKRYKLCQQVDRDYDGFSGGAIFSLVQTPNGIEPVFDGIITRAKFGYFNVVHCGFLFGLALRS